MIYINRQKRDENRRQIRPSEEWFKKAKAATKTAIKEKRKHKWDDNIYANKKEVRTALEKLFNYKCAYCEKSLLGIDWEVEHYRPKGKVAKRKDHPGYYWLGYKWENLYPACTHCNQMRIDKPLWDDPRELPAMGKSIKFPLRYESTRAMSHNEDIKKEYTLLIDPCYDDPELYFGYNFKGEIFALDEDDPCGDKSIEVYNLKERRLEKKRLKTIKSTVGVLVIMKSVQKVKPVNREALKASKELLQELVSDEAQHAGVARFVKDNTVDFLG